MEFNPIRLPHSEISGSKVVCTSPKLIAAYHVFHRLLAPRHSLYALNNLISHSLEMIMIKRVQISGFSLQSRPLARTSVVSFPPTPLNRKKIWLVVYYPRTAIMCLQVAFTTCLSLIFIVFNEINRIEVRSITVLKKLHMDVKERRFAKSMGHRKILFLSLLRQ